jgi:excisionase family DNA binding protein
MYEPQWVTIPTAARRLCISREKVRRLLRAGKLEGRKIGGSWEVRKSQITRQMLLPFGGKVDGRA